MKKGIVASLSIGMLLLGMVSMASADLIAHWGFDETTGTIAHDSVGSVDGTIVGGAALTTTGGIKGGAIQVNVNSYVDMGNNFPATNSFSIQAWVKLNPGDTSPMTPVSKHWATIAKGYFLAINNIGDGYTQTNTEGFYSANGPYRTAVGGPAVNDGLWHQLVGVYNNGLTSIYVNGNLAGTGSAGYSNNTAHFLVGGCTTSGGSPANVYLGFIDEVEVYNNALTASEVKDLYNGYINPAPLPASAWLLGSALLGLMGWRRFGKK